VTARALTCTALLALAPHVRAADGVIEISQAAALAGGVTANDDPDFPVEINAPGSYRLTSDLVVGANQDAISIASGAAGSTLDLNGFAIRGPVTCTGGGATLVCQNTGTGDGITGLASDVVVHGGAFQGLGRAAIDLQSRVRIADVAIDSCGIGVDCGSDCWLARVRVERIANTAVTLSAGGTVTESVVRNSLLIGIAASSGSRVLRSEVSGNGQAGIDLSTGSAVLDSSVSGNGGAGIDATNGSLVARSSVRANGGVGLELTLDAGYSRNVISNNGGVEVSGGVDLGGNLCDGGGC
jgi:hypothetical protein